MARVLIIGCGCRGRALASELLAAGHAVRGTTRDPARAAAIAATGAEPYVGDPDRVASLMEALVGVSVVCWLLGSATGGPDAESAVNGPRLRMLWEKLVDTPVRGIVYEAAGPLEPETYARGRAIAEHARGTWAMPVEVLAADPADHAAWLSSATAAVEHLLTRR